MGDSTEVIQAHLASLAPLWAPIYDQLAEDFADDGCKADAIAIDALLGGNPLADPPTGLGYNRPSLDAFLDHYLNGPAGQKRYNLQKGTRITADIVAASCADPSIVTLVNLIEGHQC